MEHQMTKPSNIRLVLAALGSFLILAASAVVSNSTSYFIVAVTEALGVTRAEFSVYYTIVSICTAIMSVLCGSIIPKIGIRKGFLIGTFGVGAGFLIMANLNSLAMVYIGAAFIGASQAFILVPPVAVVNAWFPKEHNGLVMGITMAGTGGGGIVMAQVMPRVVEYVDWRTGYMISAVMFVVVTIIGNILCAKIPEVHTEEQGESKAAANKKDAGYRKKVFSAAFLLIVFSCVLKCFASVFNQHYSAHLQDSFSVAQVATVMTVFNVALLIMKISQGALYDKLKYKVMLILVFASSFAYFGLTTKNFAVVCASTVIVMFCCSAETVLTPLFLTEMFGKEFSSMAWGICWGSLYAGNAMGAVLWGAIYDKFGTYNVGLRLEPIMIALYCAVVFTGITLAKKRNAEEAAA